MLILSIFCFILRNALGDILKLPAVTSGERLNEDNMEYCSSGTMPGTSRSSCRGLLSRRFAEEGAEEVSDSLNISTGVWSVRASISLKSSPGE